MSECLVCGNFFHFNLTLCFKFIFFDQVDKWNEVCQIDCMLVVEVNLGQLDRVL